MNFSRFHSKLERVGSTAAMCRHTSGALYKPSSLPSWHFRSSPSASFVSSQLRSLFAMSLDSDGNAVSRRKALKVAVAALCSEVGFGMAEDAVLETLTEALGSYIVEIGRSTRGITELAGRTDSMVSDVVLALVEMGLDIRGIPTHARRANKTVFIPPATSSQTQHPRTLQVGEKRHHPTHIPDHLPPFPDPHTYIKSDAIRQPFNEYQLIREKAATQKRDVERALTRFIAKTGETQSLFKDDVSAFPLIAVKPTPLPYLDALLPKDQDIDSLEQELQHRTKLAGTSDDERGHAGSATNGDSARGLQSQESADADAIDNPYLRHTRMPSRKR